MTATPAPSATPGFDVCGLVTPTVVSAAFGGSAGAGVPEGFLGSPTCNVPVTGSNLHVDLVVQVILLTTYDATTFAQLKPTGIAAGQVDLRGVGDNALYDPVHLSVLFVKGNRVYFVGAIAHPPSGVSLDPAKVKGDLVAVAKSVAGAAP